MLTAEVLTGENSAAFDLDDDSLVNEQDHRIWVKDLKHTWFGDANLDGEFNSADFVQVFQAGKYGTGEELAGPKATGTATASSTAPTSSRPLSMAATSRDRGRMWLRCRSRHRCFCS